MKGIWFGHPEVLANLAAIVSHGKSPKQAVQYALELCCESEKALESLSREEGGVPGLGIYPYSTDETIERLQKMERWKNSVPKPPAFPATLGQFLQIVVKAKTNADRIKRFREFHRQVTFKTEQDPGASAADLIGRIKEADKQGGFFSATRWEITGGSYLEWWKGQRSVTNRKNAKTPKKRKPTS
jgi:hypothetical protein